MKPHSALKLAVAGTLLLGTAAIDERTLECEQAISHLRSCCANLDAKNACGDGCSPVTLTLDESHCLQDSSCEAIRASSVCERVETASRAAHDVAADETDAPEREEVCP